MLSLYKKNFLLYAFLLSSFCLWAEPENKEQAELTTAPKDSELWEEAQGKKLLAEAISALEKKDYNSSILVLSELVEFFPNSSQWPKACLLLAERYLEMQAMDSSEKLLNRVSKWSKQDQVHQLPVLLAHWDFFDKSRRYDELIAWIDRRPPEQKNLLRRAPETQLRLEKLLVTLSLPTLKSLLEAMNKPEPLEYLIHSFLRLSITLPTLKQETLKALVLERKQLSTSLLLAQYFASCGLYQQADQVYQSWGQAGYQPWWEEKWLPILMEGHLWGRARLLLSVFPEQKRAELGVARFRIFSGLKQWKEACTAFENTPEACLDGSAFTPLRRFVENLSQRPELRDRLQKSFISLPPQKQLFLLALLDFSILPEKSEKELTQLLAEDCPYRDHAQFLLAELASIQGKYKKSFLLLQELQARTLPLELSKLIRPLLEKNRLFMSDKEKNSPEDKLKKNSPEEGGEKTPR